MLGELQVVFTEGRVNVGHTARGREWLDPMPEELAHSSKESLRKHSFAKSLL